MGSFNWATFVFTDSQTVDKGHVVITHTPEDSDSKYKISFDGGQTWAFTAETGSASYDIPSGTILANIEIYWYCSNGAYISQDFSCSVEVDGYITPPVVTHNHKKSAPFLWN